MDHSRGAPSDSDVPSLEYLERDNRGVEQVPQFMSEEPSALVPSRGFTRESGLISLTSILRNRAGDGIVKASVQRTKVVRADRHVQFHRQLRDGLTDIAIVVHDLRHGKPLKQEVMSMLDRAPANLGARNHAEA